MNPSTQVTIFWLMTIVAVIMVHFATAFQLPSTSYSYDHVNSQSNVLSRRQYLTSAVTTTALVYSETVQAKEDVLNYQGVYTDYNHSKGYKILIGDVNKARLQIFDASSHQVNNIPVIVRIENGATTLTFQDISTNMQVVGILTKDEEGVPLITFPNTSWKKRETGPIGVYYDNSNSAKRIIIRQLKGVDWAVDIIDGEEVKKCSAKAANPILFRLHDKGVGGVFNTREKTMTFDDGTVWIKF